MKIHLLSDLHLEFQDWTPPATDADVVVLAGDIHLGTKGVAWATKHFSKPVLYVAGNHEMWENNLTTLSDKMRQAAGGSPVRVLQDDVVILGGVRFIGMTLWTDFALLGEQPEAMRAAQMEMNDYKRIRTGTDYRRARPQDTRLAHARSLAFLKEVLAQPFAGKTVVISHHAPSARSVAPEFVGSTLSAAYASRLHAFFGAAIHLWLHGHMHTSSDYVESDTRIVCNPRGYAPKDLNPEFSEKLVLCI